MPDDPETDESASDGEEFNPYENIGWTEWGKWKKWSLQFLHQISQLPRLLNGVADLGLILLTFLVFNLDNFATYVERMPGVLLNALKLLTKMLNAGAAVMNWSLPGWALEYLRFLNAILPLSEVFAGISAIVGLYGLCFFIRAVLKFTIIFR